MAAGARRINAKLIRILMQKISLSDGIVKDIFDNCKPTYTRILWGSVLLVCLFTCCYQTGDRIAYYFQDPTAVDVSFRKLDSFMYPSVRFCSMATSYVEKFTRNSGIDLSGFHCKFAFYALLNEPGVNFSEMWDVGQNQFKHFEIKTLNNSVDPSKFVREMSSIGLCNSVKLDHDGTGVLKATMRPYLMCSGKAVVMAEVTDGTQYLQYLLLYFTGRKYSVDIHIKKHYFLNTKKNPCTDATTFKRCAKRCLNKLYTSKLCWLPFMGSKFDPQCSPSHNTIKIMEDTMLQVFQLNPKLTCNCHRKCKDSTLEFSTQSVMALENTVEFEYKLSSNNILISMERWQYDTISLMADIAGNVGLWLGLSILSTAEMVSELLKLKERCKKQQKLLKRTCHQRIIERIKQIQEDIAIDAKNQAEVPKFQPLNILKRILHFCLICFTCVLIQLRISHFYNNFSHSFVEVEDIDKVQFPDIFICGFSWRIDKLETLYAAENDLENTSCKIDFLDLLNIKKKKVSVEDLWKNSYVPELPIVNVLPRNPIPEEIARATKLTAVPTVIGTCSKYSFDQVSYYGLFTMILTIFIIPERKMCDSNSVKIYINQPNDPFTNIASRRESPGTSFTINTFKLQKIIRMSKQDAPCIPTAATYFNCRQKCLTNRIKKQLTCSLPFVPALNISSCDSAERAKQARKAYLKTQFKTDYQKDCQCYPLCEEIVYSWHIFNQPFSRKNVATLLFTVSNNKMMVVIEKSTYNFVNLVCDVGNIFSLFLGLSILSLTRFLTAQIIPLFWNSFNTITSIYKYFNSCP